MSNDTFFEGTEKPQTNTVQWGKPGDCIRGVLVNIKDNVEGKYGKTKVYTLKAEQGFYHELDEDGKPTGKKIDIVAGEDYAIFSRNTFEDDISKARIGQIIAIRFEEERKSQGNGKKYKYVECRLGGFAQMDEEPELPDFN